MALIPPFFIDSVVAIGQIKIDGTKHWIGTGFLFGQLMTTVADQKSYKIYLVTNRHVLQGQENIILRFNPQSEQSATDYPINLKDSEGMQIWTGHPNNEVDVGVISINISKLQAEGMKFSFFRSDEGVFLKDHMKEMETSEGDYIYVLGFPMGLVSENRQHVILRGGSIARIRDLFENRSTDFMVDAMVFPGNSGGPVILRPEILRIEGTKCNSNAGLIGVIKGYIPYHDVAVSRQTNKPRVIFEENSGLSLVEPVDSIIETISEDEKIKLQKKPK